MSLPQLPAALRDAYLRRLGVTEVRRDLAGLTTLQAAHLRRVPFHNLALVVNDGRPYAIPTLIDTAAANARGVGGTCHLTNPPFAALLHTLGFDVSLVAGAVSYPGDHMLALVHFDGGSYVVDVGNGHPYLRPFPLGRVMSWQAFGWPFCWRGDRLLRTFPDDQQREVYSVDTRPRTWESFHEAIRAHHEDPRFGPFFSSLRAVRMTSDVLLTVRDALLTRYGSLGPSTRPIRSADAAQRVLTECIHLPRELVEPAIAALERRRPKLFAGGSVTAPRILIAVATIGREEQLAALLESVERDRIASGLATHEIEALILDNVASDHTWAQALEQGFSVTRRPITDVSLDLERRLGLIPEEPPPVCIGAARHALVRAVADHLAKRSGEWIVWMLDDDLRLEQLIRDDEGLCVRATRPLLAELRRLWADQPELSIGVGGYSGDPPVPGFATWLGQLRDLNATLSAMIEMSPEDPWTQRAPQCEHGDFYYDHAGDILDTGTTRLFDAGSGSTVGEVFAMLARAWPSVARGSQVMRPLTYEGPRGGMSPLARGGNVVFFDRDALTATPFPAHRADDGVVTRRADSLAALLTNGSWCARALDLPVLHGRQNEDGSSPMSSGARGNSALATFVEAQTRGIALTRALAKGEKSSVAEELSRRRQLHLDGFAATRSVLGETRRILLDRSAWWWTANHAATATTLLSGLDDLGDRIPSNEALENAAADVAAELAAFLKALPHRAATWKRAWS